MKHAILYLLPLFLLSCGDDNNDPAPEEIDKTQNLNANPTAGDATRARWEMPRLDPQYDYITHATSDGQLNYAMEYCPEKFHSHWVAYRYDTRLKAQNTSRSDEWGVEPYYNNNKQYQMSTGETFRGYQRGHLVGSAERLYSREANVQTFYMSNMSPMIGAFNTTYWGEVEDKVRDNWGRKVEPGDTLYVVKGGTIDDAHIRPTRVAMHNTLGQAIEVVVPTHYFIALLMRKANGTCYAIGFYMQHKDYKNTSAEFLRNLPLAAACSIDELEKKTGIDFFCNVPDRVENYVEQSYAISAWPGLNKN